MNARIASVILAFCFTACSERPHYGLTFVNSTGILLNDVSVGIDGTNVGTGCGVLGLAASKGHYPFDESIRHGVHVYFSTGDRSESRVVWVPATIDGHTLGERQLDLHIVIEKERVLLAVGPSVYRELTTVSEAKYQRFQAAEPGATDNPGDAQRLREDH